MKTYNIPVSWKMEGVTQVKAENLQEALQIAKESQKLPKAYYVVGSLEIEYKDIPFHNENL